TAVIENERYNNRDKRTVDERFEPRLTRQNGQPGRPHRKLHPHPEDKNEAGRTGIPGKQFDEKRKGQETVVLNPGADGESPQPAPHPHPSAETSQPGKEKSRQSQAAP